MNKFYAIDFEATHKDPSRGYPWQIGVAFFDNGEVVDTFESRIAFPTHYKTGKYTKEADAIALSIGGVTLEDITEGPDTRTVLWDLNEFVAKHGTAPNVAYNSSYDQQCYRQMLFEASDWHPSERGVRVNHPEVLSPAWFDVMAQFRSLHPYETASLDNALLNYGMERSGDKHGALEDAILCGRLYFALKALLEGDTK